MVLNAPLERGEQRVRRPTLIYGCERDVTTLGPRPIRGESTPDTPRKRPSTRTNHSDLPPVPPVLSLGSYLYLGYRENPERCMYGKPSRTSWHRDCSYVPASDAGFTVVLAEEEFAAVAGEISGVAVAVLVMTPGVLGVTTISSLAVLPLGTMPRAHSTASRTPPLPWRRRSQFPWLGVAETNDALAGNRSTRSTRWSTESFFTKTVKV
jgi:hypothetical protein